MVWLKYLLVYLLLASLVEEINSVRDDNGQCIWYDTCGQDPLTDKTLNCVYNGPAKQLNGTTGLKILQKYCPSLYTGRETKTCCSTNQLKFLEKEMVLPYQILGRCHACYQNFVNMYCYMTCDPHQSDFLGVNSSNGSQITAINYTISTEFAYGMYNCCRNVMIASTKKRALGILCGRSAKDCTPEILLDFIGDRRNGETPFGINFNITDDIVPFGNRTLKPLKRPLIPCKSTIHKAVTKMDFTAKDSRVREEKKHFVSHYGPMHRREQVIIRRAGYHPRVKHNKPPPAAGVDYFDPIFDREFMHQVLALQNDISELTARFKNETVSLDDVCLKPPVLLNTCYDPLPQWNNNCSIYSPLQYYQNSHYNLDKEKWDEYHFFVLADYLDHFLLCVETSGGLINDVLGLSCTGTFGLHVHPWLVLDGITGHGDYNNATAHVLTFVLNNQSNIMDPAKVTAWEKEFIDFMRNYKNPNMTISFSSQ
ncbi:NPC intracellular cholesterol transporter 1 [Patella vulgata]|uniref:NPC intracellular cholesterol transporter 1 n=1 Tax=Patella vulgata TaxID=6465 RepID=UPI00217F92BB|nr:NPC intracellular cholesterol transporter 1 [Patella vulgata]